MPPLMGLSIFGVYQLEHELEATMAFTTLLLFNAMRQARVSLGHGVPRCLGFAGPRNAPQVA
jgi:hypothetical protein